MGKGELFFQSSSVYLNSFFFFFSNSVLEFSVWKIQLLQGLCCLFVFVHSSALQDLVLERKVGGEGRKFMALQS